MKIPSIIVAVGIIISIEKKILIAQRPQHRSYAGLWEFPGGKIEQNETIYQGLCRELSEEIGIEVVSAKPFIEYGYHYPDRHITLHSYIVEDYFGQPKGCESQIIRWINVGDLTNYSFPEGNTQMIKLLLNQ